MARTNRARVNARDRARKHQVRPFSHGTAQTPTQVIYDRRWMVWVALAVILAVTLFLAVR